MNNSQNYYNCNSDTTEIASFADWLMTLTPFEFTTLGTIIGYIISYNLTINQQNSIGNWLELVGQIVLTFNAQGSGQINNPTCQEFNELKNEVRRLQNQIARQNSNNY